MKKWFCFIPNGCEYQNVQRSGKQIITHLQGTYAFAIYRDRDGSVCVKGKKTEKCDQNNLQSSIWKLLHFNTFNELSGKQILKVTEKNTYFFYSHS